MRKIKQEILEESIVERYPLHVSSQEIQYITMAAQKKDTLFLFSINVCSLGKLGKCVPSVMLLLSRINSSMLLKSSIPSRLLIMKIETSLLKVQC